MIKNVLIPCCFMQVCSLFPCKLSPMRIQRDPVSEPFRKPAFFSPWFTCYPWSTDPTASVSCSTLVSWLLRRASFDSLVSICLVELWQRQKCLVYPTILLFFVGPSTDSSEDDLSLCALGGSATVLEESRKEAAPAPLPASGPELAALMKIGTRVMRGVDWKWGDQVSELFLEFCNSANG